LGRGVREDDVEWQAGAWDILAKDGLGRWNHLRNIACGDLTQSFHVGKDLAQLSGELGGLIRSQG